MRTKGKITSWNDDKGYGFITPNTGGKRIFVHVNAFGHRSRRPEVDQTVTFVVSTDKQGRPCAVRATLAGDRLTQQSRQANGSVYILMAVFFFVLVGAAVLADRIPSLVLVIYMVASLITFIIYAEDKSAAKNGLWRTPESTLHVLSLAGGWPGALVAQQKLRHKSRKQSFRSVFWLTVLLNSAAFVWLLTPTGTATLHSLVAVKALVRHPYPSRVQHLLGHASVKTTETRRSWPLPPTSRIGNRALLVRINFY